MRKMGPSAATDKADAPVHVFLHRFIAQSEHLAELYLSGTDYDVGDQQVASINSVDLDLDTLAAGIGHARQTVAAVYADEGDLSSFLCRDCADSGAGLEIDAGNSNLEITIFTPLQSLLQQSRTAKVVSRKLLRRLQELNAASSSVRAVHSPAMAILAENATALASVASRVRHSQESPFGR